MAIDCVTEDDFHKSDFHTLMENGVESLRYENPVRWGLEFFVSEHEYRISMNYDKRDTEPHVLIYIQPKDDVDLSDRDLLGIMKDLCKDFDVIGGADDFQKISIIGNDGFDDLSSVEAEYGFYTEIRNENADAFLSVDVIHPENCPEISEGRFGYAKILNDAKCDLASACIYLDEKLPVRESVRYTDAEKNANETVKDKILRNQDNIAKRSAADENKPERGKETVSI